MTIKRTRIRKEIGIRSSKGRNKKAEKALTGRRYPYIDDLTKPDANEQRGQSDKENH